MVIHTTRAKRRRLPGGKGKLSILRSMLSRGTPKSVAIVTFKASASVSVGLSSASISITESTTAKSDVVGTGVGLVGDGVGVFTL